MIKLNIDTRRIASDSPHWLSCVEQRLKDRYNGASDTVYSTLHGIPEIVGNTKYKNLGWEHDVSDCTHCEVDEENATVMVFRTTEKKPIMTIKVEQKEGFTNPLFSI